MKTLAGIAFMALVATSALAVAQTPPNQPLTGSVTLAVGGTTLRKACYIEHGVSTFQRNGSAPTALIALSNITQGGVELSGQDVLSFTAPSSGTVHFKQFPGLVDPAFISYAQSYDAVTMQLKIDFTISFPDCSLPIHAVYNSL